MFEAEKPTWSGTSQISTSKFVSLSTTGLEHYFNSWLERLGVSEEMYQQVVEALEHSGINNGE